MYVLITQERQVEKQVEENQVNTGLKFSQKTHTTHARTKIKSPKVIYSLSSTPLSMSEREYFSVRYLVPGSTFLFLIIAYNIFPLYRFLGSAQTSVSLFSAVLAVL